jgi:predicted GTPase
MTAAEYVQKLIDISTQKMNSMNDILDLTKNQESVITEDTFNNIEEIINQKQALIDAINKLDENFDVYYTRLKTTLGVSNLENVPASQVPGVAELKKTINSIFEIMEKIKQLEKENKAKADLLLNNLGQQIKKVNQGKLINNSYNGIYKQPQSSYYFDTKK